MSGSPELISFNKMETMQLKRQESAGKDNYQTVCPKCGSDKMQAIQETKTRGVSTINSTAGCCCLGPIGILCGLPGAGKSSTKTMRMCLNCGKKF